MHILDYTAAGAEGDPLLRPRAASVMACPLIIHSSHLSCVCFALRAWPSLAASGAGRPLFPFFLVPQLVSIVRVILANFRHEAGHSLYTARRGAALVWPTCDHFTFFLCLLLRRIAAKVVNEKTGNNYFGVIELLFSDMHLRGILNTLFSVVPKSHIFKCEKLWAEMLFLGKKIIET